jgi:hypothetical protein
MLALLTVRPAQAQFFATNPRALGMGGAFTAIADDIYSARWNPAGFSYIHGFQLGLASGQVHGHNITEILNTWNNLSQDSLSGYRDLLKYVAEHVANTETDFSVSEATAMGAAGFGLTLLPFGQGTLSPRDKDGNIGIDFVHLPNLGIYVPAAGSSVTFDGALGVASALTYGWKQRNANGLRLGANLNFVFSEDRFSKATFNGLSRDPFTVELTRSGTQTTFGVDVGALYPTSPDVRVGALLRNLISPGTASLNAPTRLNVGAAWWSLHRRLIVSGDIVNIFGQTYLNLGAEYKALDILPLRIGLYRDVPTFGLGIGRYFNIAYSPSQSFLGASITF